MILINIFFRTMEFMGEYEVVIDEKNRVMIPSKWRGHFTSDMSVILSKGFDGCLSMRNNIGFQKLSETIGNMPEFSKEKNLLQRMMIGRSKEIKLDKWFRFVISSSFGDFKGEVMLLGVGDYAEIWKRDAYNKWIEDNESFLEKGLYIRN